MENGNYSIIAVDALNNELEKYKECFDSNGTERNIQNLQWLHQQNLVKTSLIYYAVEKEDNAVAAIYTALPVIATIRGTMVNAIQSIDTLTDKNHRGKGLFIALAKELYEQATKKEFVFVYGFPNEKSGPGFFKKLGWISFGEVPFLIKPLKISYFIKKIFNIKNKKIKSISSPIENISYKNNIHIKYINEFKEDYEKLWISARANIQVAINRDAAYMNWRFINKPDEFYYRYGIYLENKLQAIIIFTIKNKHQGFIAYIMEFIYPDDKMDYAKKLLRFTNKFVRSQNVDVILAWSFSHSFSNKTFRKSGYLKMPVWLRPQKLFFGVKPFDQKSSESIINLKNWYISFADSDTV